MKVYKASMLIAAAVIALLMAWCGVAAAVTAPVLVLQAVQTRSVTGMLLLTVLLLSGMIAAQMSRQLPSPLPQLLMSAALGTGYTVITAWLGGLTASQLAEKAAELLPRAIQTTGLVLPALSAASAMCSLPFILTKRTRRKSHALLSFFALLALIVAADSVMVLLDLPVLTWQRIAQHISALSASRYKGMLLAAMQAYNGIPILARLIPSAVIVLILGRAEYVAGCRKLHRRTRAAQSRQTATQPARPPVSRPAAPAPRPSASASQPAAPAPRPAASVQRSQPRSSGISARDSALLDALAAQTISGRPIGLNTATGIPSVTENRRSGASSQRRYA